MLKKGILYVHLTEICPICLENLIDGFRLSCNHSFCLKCITDEKSKASITKCPICRSPIPNNRYFKYMTFQHTWFKCKTCPSMGPYANNESCYRCETKYTIEKENYNHLVEEMRIDDSRSILRFVSHTPPACCICEFGGNMALIYGKLYHIYSKELHPCQCVINQI